MGLQVFGNGKAGEIILHDQRPDGTAILLVCTEFAPAAGRATSSRPASPHDEVGVGVASSTDGGIFPMLEEGNLAQSKFKLHLDTTAMPGGIMRFGIEPFTRRALEAADEGYREVDLTMENAPDWGWQGTPDASGQPTESGIAKDPAAPTVQPSASRRATSARRSTSSRESRSR